MKIRMGFVSNSSTSSFAVYGIEFDEPCKIGIDTGDEDSDSTQIYKICRKFGLESYDLNECEEGWVIGLSWGKMDDNETKAQFKKRVEELIQQITCNNKLKCQELSGTYPN